MNTSDKEQRAYMCDVATRSDEVHGNILEGVPIVYDAATDIGGMWKEIIDRGALDNADLKDVRFLVNHDTDSIPLARSRNNNENSTMQMTVDEGGMNIRVNLDIENNTEARSLYSAVERGDIDGMSFMFIVDGELWEEEESDHPKRTITDIEKVFEVSAVTFPAYEQTSISARGLADALESAKASLESVRAEKRAIEDKKKRIKILSQM